MRRASTIVVAGMAIIAALASGGVDARQAAAPQSAEEARRLAEEQAEAEMKAIEEAEAQWRAEWEVTFKATAAQRAEFDQKMEDFADAHSKDAGTRVQYVMGVGDNGLPEYGEVWFVNRGFVTHRAEFDANGNTKGLFITPDGRARQSITAHRTPGVPASGRYLFTTGPDGRTQISDVTWSAEDGTRGHMKFNLDGVAYFGEFWGADGQRSGGFYDASLEPTDPPPPALFVPPVPRISTQPCEPCRAASDAYNEIVHKMQPIQREMAELARAVGKTTAGRERNAIVQRYNVLKQQWDAGAPALEAALAALRACTQKCNRTSENRGAVTTAQMSLPGAADPTAAVVVHDAVSGRDHLAMLAHGQIVVGLNRGAGITANMFEFRQFAVAPSATNLLAGDFNADGRDDLVYLDPQAHLVALVLNDGNNFFLKPQFRETGAFIPVAARLGDVNDDDRLDLVVAQQATGVQGNQSIVTTLFGDGSGSLSATGPQLIVPNFALSLTGGLPDVGTQLPRVVDFNTDGFPDFAVATSRGSANAENVAPSVTLLLNRPDAPGNFAAWKPFELTDLRSGVRLATADLNGDGIVDLVSAGSNGVHVVPGARDGKFTVGTTSFFAQAFDPFPGAGVHVAVADYNADGMPDLVVNQSRLLLNTTPRFGAGSSFAFEPNFRRGLVVGAGDFNDDGYADLLQVHDGQLTVTPGSATPPATTTQTGASTPAIAKALGAVLSPASALAPPTSGASTSAATGTMRRQDLASSTNAYDQTFLRTAAGSMGMLGADDEVRRTVNADGSVSYLVVRRGMARSHPYRVYADGTVVDELPSAATGLATTIKPENSAGPIDGHDLGYHNDWANLAYAREVGYGLGYYDPISRVTNPDGSVTFTNGRTKQLHTVQPDGSVRDGAWVAGTPVAAASLASKCDDCVAISTAAACTGSGCSSPLPSIACDLPGCGPAACTAGETCTDLASFSNCQECTQIGSAGERDQTVQYMIIEIILVRAAERLPALPSIANAARSLWGMLRNVVTGSLTVHATRRAAPGLGTPALNQAGRPQGAVQSGATTVLTSLGTSQGEAFQIQVANDGKTPINLRGNGVIVEPLRQAAAQQAKRAMSQLASRNPVTQKLDAYCVEMLKQPPSLGTLFRVASPEIQKKFAPMRQVLQASYRLQQAGLLKPDSDPKGYFESIKQWALWSRERNFNEKSYGDAFVEHTKKGATERGVRWTNDIEKGVRALVPHRWEDISRILQAAR